MPIAELFLGALLTVLLERLASRELLNFVRPVGIDKFLKNWEKMLISINQVLVDAEDKQLTGDLGVKSWLEDLRNLAYDIEDLLDEFAIEYAENKSKAEPSTRKARALLPSCCFKLSPRALMLNHRMRSKIKEMDGRLQEIIARKDGLGLREGIRSAYPQQNKRIPTTSGTEPCFVSREDEKREILEFLTREEDDGTCVDPEAIAIVGMGGVGKTALVQQIYNDASLAFVEKAWVCVSDDFNVPSITKSILEAFNCHLSCKDRDLNWLQDQLKKNLSGKKFLVIFDDVWNKNYENWTILMKPFQSRVKGSKIIITTRDLDVASMANAQSITLGVLSLDDCMTLFAFHALGVQNFDHHPKFEALGRKIVEKCQGLPLAVKALAGLLRGEKRAHEWEAILTSKIWDLQEERTNILPALKLSYLHLPSHLKRCFAYCAIFPKDFEIQRDEVIRWWIAEGLVEEKEGKDRWIAGLNYFNELVSRSLFQKLSSSESQYLMHDLVNDLAKVVAGATHLSSGEFEFKCDQTNLSLARHASFVPTTFIRSKNFEIYHEMKVLRSFIMLRKQSSYWNRSYLAQKVLCDLLSKLKYLRVLSLSHYYIEEVPDCVGKLRHLRHLDLSYTNIETLPKSIVALYNLEALMLRGCDNLIELPKDMEKLINLRFLDIRDTSKLKATPLNIGSLVGLEMLSKFVVGMGKGSRLKELKNLENLGGELCISDLHMVQDARDANEANLCMKKGICQLTMQWSTDFENFQNEELEAEVLDILRPHQNLENLKISCYDGPQFPSWLGSPLHANIVQLHLHGCQRIKALPSLGQLSSLKELYIEGLNAICTIGSELYGTISPFPSLITLEFKDMPLWEDWSYRIGNEEIGIVFPCLERLVIQECPVLVGRLPSQLGSLKELEIHDCPRMDASPSTTSLPSLNELNFGGCDEGVLKSFVNLTSLTALVIQDVAELNCLNHGFISSLIKLEELKLERCEKLTYLWQDENVIRNSACLKSLDIDKCHEFISFVVGEGDMELPDNLKTIKLSNCINLEKLPSNMHTLSSLEALTIKNCPKLVSFPDIPMSVKSLYIKNCRMLQSLPRGLSFHLDESSSGNNYKDMTSCLQILSIKGCDSLSASPFSEVRFLPATLEKFEIVSCKGVESLTEIHLDRLQSLQEIKIKDCENLRSLPQSLHTLPHLTSLKLHGCHALEVKCFPPLSPSISDFLLWECPKIKSLPNQLYRLTYLRKLSIIGCKSITCFPDGGLPPQLRMLTVDRCENMKQPVREWLTPLTSLQELWVDGSVGGVGEEEDLVLPLPSSLLHLEIWNMKKVERLSSNSLPPSLRKLWIVNCPKLRELPQDGLPPSLRELWIMDCPKLRELPQDGLPPSLRELWIMDCPKLRELPQDGLPPSLEQLHSERCGKLEERCKKGTGCYWPLIRQIPYAYLLFPLSSSPLLSFPLFVAVATSIIVTYLSLLLLLRLSTESSSSPQDHLRFPLCSREDFHASDIIFPLKSSIHQKWKELGISFPSSFTDTKCLFPPSQSSDFRACCDELSKSLGKTDLLRLISPIPAFYSPSKIKKWFSRFEYRHK
ncbi:hypothetical protein BT93_B1801 [Corymbia citriodora subsp. variegata]|nr:hypothetical protein BT93_B1801 [Corymbia citriodora subsp. variegata]